MSSPLVKKGEARGLNVYTHFYRSNQSNMYGNSDPPDTIGKPYNPHCKSDRVSRDTWTENITNIDRAREKLYNYKMLKHKYHDYEIHQVLRLLNSI